MLIVNAYTSCHWCNEFRVGFWLARGQENKKVTFGHLMVDDIGEYACNLNAIKFNNLCKSNDGQNYILRLFAVGFILCMAITDDNYVYIACGFTESNKFGVCCIRIRNK